MRHLVAKPLKAIEVEGLNFANGFLGTDLKVLPDNPDFGMTCVHNQRRVKPLDDQISEPYGVRTAGWISLSRCQQNRAQLKRLRVERDRGVKDSIIYDGLTLEKLK